MKIDARDYEEKFQNERMQFLFLCGKADADILLRIKKSKMEDYVRIACIAVILGYKTVFLDVVVIIESRIGQFMKELEKADNDIEKLNRWMSDFTDGIACSEAKVLVCQLWEEQKKNLNASASIIKRIYKQK